MRITLADILAPGMKFRHEYDFGATTELSLKVVSELEGESQNKSIQLLAMNDPPSIACEVWGEITTQLCSERIWEGKGWLCDGCAGKHSCGEEMAVNSPRSEWVHIPDRNSMSADLVCYAFSTEDFYRAKFIFVSLTVRCNHVRC